MGNGDHRSLVPNPDRFFGEQEAEEIFCFLSLLSRAQEMSFSLAYRWADDSCLHGGACTIPLSVLAGARNALRIFATSRTRGPGSLGHAVHGLGRWRLATSYRVSASSCK